MKKILIATLGLGLAGCSTSATKIQRVSDAAAFDLDCSKSELTVSKINETSYAASGCNKRARYILDTCGTGALSSRCRAFIDGPVHVK
jgi:hypothetical protein